MGRPKKDGRALNCYIKAEIIEKLEEYCEEMGQTKTIVVERALEQVFSEHDKNKKKNKN